MTKKTMLDYVSETPALLEKNWACAAELTAPLVSLLMERPFRLLRIVASGSSCHSAWCARPLMRRLLGLEVLITPPHTFTYHEHELPDDQLTLVVSQSGYSTNALAAADIIRKSGSFAVGITGNSQSDLKDHCDLLVDYGVGTESVGYVTKGVSSLVLFFQLFAIEGGLALGRLSQAEAEVWRADLSAAIQTNRQCLQVAPTFLKQHYMELSSMGTVFLCGSNSCYGAALEGALKLCETVQVPAFAYESEEYLHGPELQLTPSHTVFFLDNGGADSARTRALWEATCLVTRRSYLLTSGNRAPQDSRVLPLDIPPEAELSALGYLPLFQIMAYQITEDKHLWHKHPLCAKLEHTISGKSPNYVHKEVL